MSPDDPVVVVPWRSSDDEERCEFIDLRLHLAAISQIKEVTDVPALRSALLLLNGGGSQFFTAKCDYWTAGTDGVDLTDPFEMDAQPDEVAFTAGSYVDLLARDIAGFRNFAAQEQWLRSVTEGLRKATARASRIDLVMRPATHEQERGYAVTWFTEGCGRNAEAARARWAEALQVGLQTIMNTGFRSERA